MKWITLILIILVAVLTYRLNKVQNDAEETIERIRYLRDINEQELCGYELANYGLCNTPFTIMTDSHSEQIFIYIRNNHNITKEFDITYHIVPNVNLNLILPEGPFIVKPKELIGIKGFAEGNLNKEAKFIIKITADEEDYALGNIYVR